MTFKIKISVIALLVLGFASVGYARFKGPVTVEEDRMPWHVDMTAYKDSYHGSFGCMVCHRGPDYESRPYPHGIPLSPKKDRVPFDYAMCKSCHPQEWESYSLGEHERARAEEARGKIFKEKGADKAVKAPYCADCHQVHFVSSDFNRQDWIDMQTATCGKCHEHEAETYLLNYHGKTSALLNFEASASCADCHGGHSTKHLDTVEEAYKACKRCHPNSDPKMTGYMIHADEAELSLEGIKHTGLTLLNVGKGLFNSGTGFFSGMTKEEKVEAQLATVHMAHYFMILLLAVTVGFFYPHSVLMLVRKGHERLRGKYKKRHDYENEELFWRFRGFFRFCHLLLMISLFGLIFSGMPLSFPKSSWAPVVVDYMFFGPNNARLVHRGCALLLIFTTVLYLGWMIKTFIKIRWELFSARSMVPNLKDFKDMYFNIKYMLGLGPEPKFERYSYWEKFDFFAIFWGVPVIGLPGFLLWFNDELSPYLPGFVINIAAIVHAEEGLLAMSFLFFVHFINTALRPDKFPYNRYMFTGKITKSELMEEYPLEWARMVNDPELMESLRVKTP